MKVLITGGTGFIGSQVTLKLVNMGHEVVLLTRGSKKLPTALDIPGVSSYPYAFKEDSHLPLDLMQQIDGIINMAGEPIFTGRWTQEKKQGIVSSRIPITRQITESIASLKGKKPTSFVSASAVGYYGAREEEELCENDSPGSDFLANLAVQWEKEALNAEKYGTRTVVLRTGIVLDIGGGALAKMLPPFKYFIGGPIGSGKQYVSWIHREDMVNLYIEALLNPKLKGPLNATAPNPVTMKELSQTIGKVMHRPSWFPVPGFMLKLLIGESAQVILTGQKVIPDQLKKQGYQFCFPLLEEALRGILETKKA
jgi:hypothetical protein